MKPSSRRRCITAALSVGLLGGLGGCGVVVRAVRERSTGMASPGPTDAERARIAWQYFRTARNGATGLVDAVAGGGFATTSTLGDQIAAAIAARRLGVIDAREFDAAVTQVLVFLGGAPLAGGQLPARFYGIGTGQLMDPPQAGTDPGWSGVELGRLLFWLRALAVQYPQYAYAVAGAVDRWDVCAILDQDGTILQRTPGAGGLVLSPDRGSGYEALAAQGLRAWGMSPANGVPAIRDYSVEAEGIAFPIGTAEAPMPPLHPVPFALVEIESGWGSRAAGASPGARAMAQRLFDAQERRRAGSGIATARGDFRRTSDPYAVTGSVVGAGTPWNTIDAGGKSHAALALVSTKAAFAQWAVDASRAKAAMAVVGTLYDRETGWFEGRYESSGGYEWTRTASTNAIVLEALLYRELGPIAPINRETALTPGGASGVACGAG